MTQAFNLALFANNLNTSGQANATTSITGIVPTANLGTGTANGSTFLAGDQTYKTIASRNGFTNAVFSSSTNNITLTAGSGQLVRICSNGTNPAQPISLTLPNATTMFTGVGYFEFENTIPSFALALKDTGGTTREYIDGDKYSTDNAETILYPIQEPTKNLKIQNTATANGVWFVNNPPSLGAAVTGSTLVATFNLATAGNYTFGQIVYIPIDNNGNFICVWVELNTDTFANTAIFAQPYSVNYSTGVITQGTRITVQALNTAFANGGSYQLTYDTDNAGHALLLVQSNDDLNTYSGIFGLTYASGTNIVYSSARVALLTTGVFCDNIYRGRVSNMGYLGSGSAYGIMVGAHFRQWTLSAYQYTVTGTTSAILTAVGTTINVAVNGNYRDFWIVRTGLTSFVHGTTNTALVTANYFINYTVGSANTGGTATSTVRPALATFWSYITGSRVMSGFQASASKVLFGGIGYDITSAGAIGVTSAFSTTITNRLITAPTYQSTSYNSINRNIITTAWFYPTSGSSTFGFGRTYYSFDTSIAGLNITQAGGSNSFTKSNQLNGKSVGYAVRSDAALSLSSVPVNLSNSSTPVSISIFSTLHRFDATPFTF